MPCGIYYRQVSEVERALRTMRNFGLEQSPAYNQLFSVRGKLLGQVGFKFPRTAIQLLKLIALSPGTIILRHDIELGWQTEARSKPGAPPIIKSASDEVAITLLKGELTHELEEVLMTPDDYQGE